jgi:hypothetical protein
MLVSYIADTVRVAGFYTKKVAPKRKQEAAKAKEIKKGRAK